LISIGKLTSVEQAVRYLREAVANQQLEYYNGHGESPGRWGGDGVAALGLHGEVTDADFTAVLSGLNPQSGETLGRQWASHRVVAFDVAVSAPKDMSILYALGDEQQRAAILRIHSDGVRAAAGYLQAHAGWARKFNPESRRAEPVRAKLLMPEFVHRTARPVTDPGTGTVTVDPQLHTHITIPNWARRPDGTWGQLWAEPLYQHAAAAGAMAQAEWRDRLVRELGICTVVDGNGCFSILGITEAQRNEFSRRKLQIEAAERALDIDSFHGRKVAVVDTRESKHCLAPSDDLFAQWRQRAANVGLDGTSMRVLLDREPAAHLPRRLDVSSTAEIVGIRGLTAQRATFSRRDVIRAVAAHAPLGMARGKLEATADQLLSDRGAVLPLVPENVGIETDADAMHRSTESGRELRYTTPEMLAIEERMVATAHQRIGAGAGIAAPSAVAAVVAARPSLTKDQRALVETVCSTPAGVVVVEGAAGVGKTFALDACREAFVASDVPVVGCALAGRAAQGLQEGSAIPSWTVDSMLNELQLNQLPAGGVLVVDEAGMIGDRQLADLMSLAARDGTKLVLVGDPRQLQPIEAGAPLRMLGERIGKVAVTENVRQEADWERIALSLMRDGESRAALEQYLRHARVHTAPSAVERNTTVVEDYRHLTARGVDAVILARRRDDVAALNEVARSAMTTDGRLTGPSLAVDGKDYRAGDSVVCLANDRRLRITNGMRGTVTAVDASQHTLTLRRSDGKELQIDTSRYDTIERGYALTVHKAQGMTADVALVVGSDGATREWVYTAMTRATIAAHYYDVERPAERDRLGVHHEAEVVQPSAERIAQSWSHSVQNDCVLDYPERYQALERPPRAGSSRLLGEATEAQRSLLADLGVQLPREATWIEASLEIDRVEGRTPGRQVRSWLRQLGVSDDTSAALVNSLDSPPTRAAAEREALQRIANLIPSPRRHLITDVDASKSVDTAPTLTPQTSLM